MLDVHASGFYEDFDSGAGKFVGWNAVDFFGGVDGGELIHLSVETGGEGAELVERVG